MTSSSTSPRRADARRSRTAILDAALRLLDGDIDASVGAIAAAAGVTRQTVYAHFPSREQLLGAVIDQITEATIVAMDAADAETGSAADALIGMLTAAGQEAGRYPALLQKINSLPTPPQVDAVRHQPIAERLKRVIARGQDSGEFDSRLPTDWLAAIAITLSHTAADEVDAGRMTSEEATAALHISLLRVLANGPTAPSS